MNQQEIEQQQKLKDDLMKVIEPTPGSLVTDGMLEEALPGFKKLRAEIRNDPEFVRKEEKIRFESMAQAFACSGVMSVDDIMEHTAKLLDRIDGIFDEEGTQFTPVDLGSADDVPVFPGNAKEAHDGEIPFYSEGTSQHD